ncbi:MAG TPA: D-glycero-beta-D-manno-heptose 1-phosphate adenylyltransferase [Gammaproteobacteria bacterium]|nr:D-glycero-beta-D-manno-heptose 1-phosphate adenylyltransferase [Gammaproteobacteria bacterium]
MTSEDKIVQPDAAGLTRIQALVKPLVFTNGCFDILHRGHVSYLEEARKLGASLIVAVNTDDSVRRLEKGTDRPVNTLDDRMAVIAALQSVDAVMAFDEDTPLELIRQIHPDILVKGGDWSTDRIVGADLVLADGGEVYSIPFRHDRSTTDLLTRIRNHR